MSRRTLRLRLYRWLFADVVDERISLALIRWRDAGNMLNDEQKRKLNHPRVVWDCPICQAESLERRP